MGGMAGRKTSVHKTSVHKNNGRSPKCKCQGREPSLHLEAHRGGCCSLWKDFQVTLKPKKKWAGPQSNRIERANIFMTSPESSRAGKLGALNLRVGNVHCAAEVQAHRMFIVAFLISPLGLEPLRSLVGILRYSFPGQFKAVVCWTSGNSHIPGGSVRIVEAFACGLAWS